MHPLLDPIERNVGAFPERRAVADQSLVLDYRGFQAVACGLAAQIERETQRPHVGLLAPTSSAMAAAIVACWYAGKTPVPLNFLLEPRQIAHIVADAELDLLVTVQHFAAQAEALAPRLLLLSAQTMVPGRRAAPAVEPGDLAVILYTSGTAGEPKGVRLSFDNLAQNARRCIEHAKLEPRQVFLSPLPQFHTFGLTAMTVTPLVLGASVHYLPRFSPVAMAETIAQQQVTVVMAVPSMYAALANMKGTTREMYASVELAITGGEPLPQRVAEAFEARFGVRLLEGYGMTETSPVVSLNTAAAHRLGSVGRPIPGVSVSVVGDNGAALPVGTPGELVVQGHGVMQGYHRRPEETATVLRDGGRLHTGDIGYVDEDGYVYITGRAKEMIIIGGENVAPREIENVLSAHPAVGEAAVIGMRDDLRGEAPAAFIILKPNEKATEQELREFCRGRLAGYKIPRWIRFREDLPRSATGKVLKRALSPADVRS